MSESRVALCLDPAEFFREKVTNATSQLNLKIDEQIEFYIVNLLCEFINPGKLSLDEEELDVFDTPLAIFLQKALEAPSEKRAKIFKRLADSSLYVAGFFQDYFTRKTFHIDYYIDLGSSAYRALASITSGVDNPTKKFRLYSQLAQRFPQLVDLVAEVSEIPGARRPEEILAIYDRWTRYPSERLTKLLSELGIAPIPGSMKQAQ